MSRVQLAINVENLDEAIDFYSRLFDAMPAKVKPGYANFAIAEPPLKLVLFENQGKGGSINHLGVEVQTTEEVLTTEDRLTRTDMVTTGIDETQCCYAEKTEVWVDGPDGVRWEWYVKHADSDQFENVVIDPSQSKRKCCT
jgi:catechol 2,3-dioxygenase-like lactoylglutathione lyase family enzyme